MPKQRTLPRGKHRAFAARLDQALQSAGISGNYRQIGKVFKVSATTVGNLLRGDKLPSTELASEIAAKTRVSFDWLMTGRANDREKDGAELSETDSNGRFIRGNVRILPVFTMPQIAAAGCKGFNPIDQTAKGYQATQTDHAEGAFFVEVSGASMDDGTADGYPDGCQVLCEPASEGEHGDDVIICCDGDRVLLRRLQISGDGAFLLALNPSWPNRIIEMPPDAQVIAVCVESMIVRKRK